MNSLKKLIENRRAVFPRQYNDEPIAEEAIQSMLEAANWAPTHKRTEPWRFKVLQGEKLKEFGTFMAEQYKSTAKKFSERKYERTKEKFLQSGAVIVLFFQRDPKKRIPEWEEIAATAMAVQNMWLTATDLGIGAYWSSTSLREKVGGFFNLKADQSCLGFFYMGHYDDPLPEGTRKPIRDKVEWL